MEEALHPGTDSVLALHRLLVEDTRPEVVGEAAVAEVARLLGGAAALWQVEGDEVALTAFDHPDPAAHEEMLRLTGGRLRGPHALVRGVLQGGETVLLDGAQVAASLPVMEPAYREFYSRHPVAVMALRPLRFAGAGLGVLGVSREDRPFDQAELELLGHVGYVVAVALQAVRFAEAQQRRVVAAQREGEVQQQLAQTDDLTALLNRRGFSRRLPAPTDRLDRAVGVLVLDLDDFKAVNDSFGHATGDALLLSCAASLAAALPPGAAAARIGGDEFAVLLQADDAEGVRSAVRALDGWAPRHVRLLGVEVPLRASAGLAVADRGEAFDPARLLQHADVAMYRAKRSGDPAVPVRTAEYDAELDAPALRRLPDAARLRTGIAVGELVLHYQRLVPTRVGRREHVEALVRWDRDGELLPPDRFLPLAAEIGALHDLTEAVLDAAVLQLVSWWAAGREVTVAVNVPASSLTERPLVATLVARLATAGLPVDAVSLEVTETELLQADARAAVAAARAAGIAVAIDDFGTGWSSVSHLLGVPFSTLKLDRALVAGLDRDPVRRVLVRHCIRFCHELGLEVVAEGVEEQGEQDVLTSLGVDWLQGFHLHRPCAAEELPGQG